MSLQLCKQPLWSSFLRLSCYRPTLEVYRENFLWSETINEWSTFLCCTICITSDISSIIGLSSVRLCFEQMLKTRTKACPDNVGLTILKYYDNPSAMKDLASDNREPSHGWKLVTSWSVSYFKDNISMTSFDDFPRINKHGKYKFQRK